jgi:hypothetical protein
MQFEKMERSDGVERCGVGTCRSAVIDVHASPRFEWEIERSIT